MLEKIGMLSQILKNMGWRYVIFKIYFDFQKRTGLLKRKFPTNQPLKTFISLGEWKNVAKPFFFESKEKLSINRNSDDSLARNANDILDGKTLFFSATLFNLGADYDWLTNPDTAFKYDINKHWTEINDLNKLAGDIKYVWEKSRFSYLYTLIRHDYHFQVDHSEKIIDDIISWIDANPINQGPNYVCSQEISLRIFNWAFTLYYYKNSKNLTEERFRIIMNSIYWQTKHVYENIHFSRIAVRNNHAITETLGLYIVGLLFPFFPESQIWKNKGRKWFEEEINYQIYEDGTYLQFSMNYHRVVIQLLTWAFFISSKNGEKFSEIIYLKAKKSVDFLLKCLIDENGFLPNYGANDGALFFKLNECNYRDYRPQLNALYFYLNKSYLYYQAFFQEDIFWYTGETTEIYDKMPNQSVAASFDDGGYYLIKDKESFTFLRCGLHKDRPSQADNLHLDLWVNGENIMRDAGSYKYNTGEKTLKYFMGTASHNTVMLGEYDQMLKGPRFVWLNWSQSVYAKINETKEYYEFEGKIRVFKQIASNIYHIRKVRKYKNDLKWEIEDFIDHQTGLDIIQLWHPSELFFENYKIFSIDENQKPIPLSLDNGWYSSLYGTKEPTTDLSFKTKSKMIKTTIEKISI